MSHKRHATVLTYHRIIENSLEDTKFHDVSLDQFRNQLQMIVEHNRCKPIRRDVHISFDDGTCDHFVAAELLSDFGLTGTFFIVTNRLDQKGYLTSDQVARMAHQGHRIGSHTDSGCHLTLLNRDGLDKELITSRNLLEEITGQTVNWLAPPGGICNRVVLDHALKLGYSVIRTMEWGYSDKPLHGQIPCIPILPGLSSKSFQRILNGDATLWPYAVKEIAKKLAGEKYYNKLRNQLSWFQQSIQKRI